ncbi:MAG: shikimate kinase [Candidatus Merdivicinus sp.]
MKNLVLIGMPGCGKSTVGVILAKAMGIEFLDTDLVIQKRENALLQQILNNRGLDAFLDAEEAAVCSVNCTDTVIATGGSVIYREKAMTHLKTDGIILYLQLEYPEIIARLSNITTRGIALPAGKTMEDLYRERIPLYEKYADLTIHCTGKSVEQTVEAIINAIRA